MMQGQALARTIVGIVGNVISGLLFISPCPTFWRIIKNKDTEEFHPYPYLATTMNCLMWIFYGLPIVHPDSTLVVTINSAGLFLQFCYLLIFFVHTKKNKYRFHIIGILLIELCLLAAIAGVTLGVFKTHTKRSMVVGIICIIFGIIMYGSPLSIIREVLKTKSAEFMPVWLCLAGFCNGIVWTAYAFLKVFDPYIVIPNGIGAILAFIQLALYAYFTYIHPKKDSDIKDAKVGAKHGEVQLQNTNTVSPV